MNMDKLSDANSVPTTVNNREAVNMDESVVENNNLTTVNSTEVKVDELCILNDLITVHNSKDSSFKINYAKTKNFGINNFVRSPTFTCSDYEWCIRYYPHWSHSTGGTEYISLYLELDSSAENINTTLSFHLLGEDSKPLPSRKLWTLFRSKGSTRGFHAFIRRSTLESNYLRDGSFVVHCDIRVLKEEWEKPILADEGLTPFRYLQDDLHELLKRNEMTDVIIEVEGKSMMAHRLVLAARSAVFKGLVDNLMAGPSAESIRLNEISLVVFKVLLHFMYTDALPPLQELFDSDWPEGSVDLYELTRQVLIAADTYQLDRLKRICEEKLAKHISMETIIKSLDLAHNYHCLHLKDVCFKFAIKPENIVAFMQSDGYVELMKRYPSLLVEYREFDSNFPPSKKQRTE